MKFKVVFCEIWGRTRSNFKVVSFMVHLFRAEFICENCLAIVFWIVLECHTSSDTFVFVLVWVEFEAYRNTDRVPSISKQVMT